MEGFLRLIEGMLKKELTHRVNAGLVAVRNQVKFFCDNFGRVNSKCKSDDSIVTFVDFAITERIFKELREQFASDQYFSEEGDVSEEPTAVAGKFAWLLDPVDGTENYALGMPFCAISLALLYKGKPVYGWIYDHSRQSILHGGGSYGCFQDGKKISLPKGEEPLSGRSLIALHFSRSPYLVGCDVSELVQAHRSRYLGSGALSLLYTGLGYFEGSFDVKVKPWDIAAALPILELAGRKIHFFGEACFPLAHFHPEMEACPYFAGTDSFCRWIERIMVKQKV